jgi:hypothetical protein
MKILTTCSNLFYRLFNVWTALAVTAIYIWFIATVMPQQSLDSAAYSGEWGAPDRHLFYTPDELYAEISRWDESGRDDYINFRLGLDIVWALAYTGFLVGWISLLLGQVWPPGHPARLLNTFPLITLLADYSENGLGIWLVANADIRMDMLAWLATLMTAGKWISLVLAHGILVYAAGAALLKKIRSSA